MYYSNNTGPGVPQSMAPRRGGLTPHERRVRKHRRKMKKINKECRELAYQFSVALTAKYRNVLHSRTGIKVIRGS